MIAFFILLRSEIPGLGSDNAFNICLAGDFIYKVSTESPTRHFVIHSRKAFLKGLSPADNRKIPPLKYV